MKIQTERKAAVTDKYGRTVEESKTRKDFFTKMYTQRAKEREKTPEQFFN